MASAAKKTNWFAIWISVIAVVLIVGIGFFVVWGNSQASAPGPAPESAAVDAGNGAIRIGDGADVVELYYDYACPHCQEFERINGPTIDELVSGGSITLELHPVSIMDRASGTEFSTRSAAATYCVAESDPSKVLPFMQAIFATNPSGAGLTNDELVSIASSVGVNGIDECVNTETHKRFVAAMTKNLPVNPATGRSGTPALVVNGEQIAISLNPQRDLLEHIAG